MDTANTTADQQPNISRSIRTILYRDEKVVYQTSKSAQVGEIDLNHTRSGFLVADSSVSNFPWTFQTFLTTKNQNWLCTPKKSEASKRKDQQGNCVSRPAPLPKSKDSDENLDILSRLKKVLAVCSCRPCACVAGMEVPAVPRPPRDPHPCSCDPCLCYDCTRISDDIKNNELTETPPKCDCSGIESFLSIEFGSMEQKVRDPCFCRPCECTQCTKEVNSTIFFEKTLKKSNKIVQKSIKEVTKETVEETKIVVPKRRKFNPQCSCKPCECVQCEPSWRPECRCDPIDPCVMCQGFSKKDKDLPTADMLCRLCNTLLPLYEQNVCQCDTCECTENNKTELCACDACLCTSEGGRVEKSKSLCDCDACVCIICKGKKKLCDFCLKKLAETFMFKKDNAAAGPSLPDAATVDERFLRSEEIADGHCCCDSPCECISCENKCNKLREPKPALQSLNVFNASVPCFKIRSREKIYGDGSLPYAAMHVLLPRKICSDNIDSEFPVFKAKDEWTQQSVGKVYSFTEYATKEIESLSETPCIPLSNVSTSQYIRYVEHVIGEDSSTMIINQSVDSGKGKYEKRSCEQIKPTTELTNMMWRGVDIISPNNLENKKNMQRIAKKKKSTCISKKLTDKDLGSQNLPISEKVKDIKIYDKDILLSIMNEIDDARKGDADFFRNFWINDRCQQFIGFCNDCEILREKQKKTLKLVNEPTKSESFTESRKKDMENITNAEKHLQAKNFALGKTKVDINLEKNSKDLRVAKKLNKENNVITNSMETIHGKMEDGDKRYECDCNQEKFTEICENDKKCGRTIESIFGNRSIQNETYFAPFENQHQESKHLLKRSNVLSSSLQVAQYYSEKMTYFVSKHIHGNKLIGDSKNGPANVDNSKNRNKLRKNPLASNLKKQSKVSDHISDVQENRDLNQNFYVGRTNVTNDNTYIPDRLTESSQRKTRRFIVKSKTKFPKSVGNGKSLKNGKTKLEETNYTAKFLSPRSFQLQVKNKPKHKKLNGLMKSQPAGPAVPVLPKLRAPMINQMQCFPEIVLDA